MVKLADTPDLGSGGEIRGGSSPSSRTKRLLCYVKMYFYKEKYNDYDCNAIYKFNEK